MKKRSDEESLLSVEGDPPFDAWPHVFNLANCIVGVSVLAMPYCFQQCGILLAVTMIAVSAVVTKLTCHFLFMGGYMARRRSYEALAAYTLGRVGRRVTEMLMLAFLMSSIVAFMVMIGDIGPHMVADYLELAAPTQRLRILVMVLMLIFVIFPLSTINDMEAFSVVSSMAVFFYVIFVVRMFLESASSLYEGEWSLNVRWWRSDGFLGCLPIVTMALACQTQLFHVVECIPGATVQQVDFVVSTAVNLCSAMYAFVGLFGYVAFFNRDLHGDVLVELQSSLITQLLKLAFMLSIAVSIPLMLFPARTALFNLFLRPSGCELPVAKIQRSTFHVLTLIILIINVLAAILVPNVEFVLGLTGSLIGSLISIIIPSLMFLAVAPKTNASVMWARVCVVLGVFILVVSTFVTLRSEMKTNIALRPEPKGEDHRALEHIERLEERVLDTNINISQKLDDISNLAKQGKEKEAEKLINEMKEQQKEQMKLIERQEEIVDELNKHMEKHKEETADKTKDAIHLSTITTTTTVSDVHPPKR